MTDQDIDRATQTRVSGMTTTPAPREGLSAVPLSAEEEADYREWAEVPGTEFDRTVVLRLFATLDAARDTTEPKRQRWLDERQAEPTRELTDSEDAAEEATWD